MKNYKKNTVLSIATALLGAHLLIQPTAVQADTKLYLGGNIGVSTLDPRVVGEGGVDDDSDIAYKVYAGYDVGIKKYFIIEAFYADMGAAHIKTPNVAGDVGYKLFGAGLLYNEPFNRRLSGLAKIGFADVKNDAKSEINVTQIHGSVIYLGAGLEYAFSKKLSARAEYEYYDKDIQLLSAGIRINF